MEVFSVVLSIAAERKVTPIDSILCTALGTAVGCMPYDKRAIQVSQGYFPTLRVVSQCTVSSIVIGESCD